MGKSIRLRHSCYACCYKLYLVFGIGGCFRFAAAKTSIFINKANIL